jgi:hypothetical protein
LSVMKRPLDREIFFRLQQLAEVWNRQSENQG